MFALVTNLWEVFTIVSLWTGSLADTIFLLKPLSQLPKIYNYLFLLEKKKQDSFSYQETAAHLSASWALRCSTCWTSFSFLLGNMLWGQIFVTVPGFSIICFFCFFSCKRPETNSACAQRDAMVFPREFHVSGGSLVTNFALSQLFRVVLKLL